MVIFQWWGFFFAGVSCSWNQQVNKCPRSFSTHPLGSRRMVVIDRLIDNSFPYLGITILSIVEDLNSWKRPNVVSGIWELKLCCFKYYIYCNIKHYFHLNSILQITGVPITQYIILLTRHPSLREEMSPAYAKLVQKLHFIYISNYFVF